MLPSPGSMDLVVFSLPIRVLTAPIRKNDGDIPGWWDHLGHAHQRLIRVALHAVQVSEIEPRRVEQIDVLETVFLARHGLGQAAVPNVTSTSVRRVPVCPCARLPPCSPPVTAVRRPFPPIVIVSNRTLPTSVHCILPCERKSGLSFQTILYTPTSA